MKLFTTLFLCAFTFNAVASKEAMTNEGDMVILNDDGTWVYADGQESAELAIPTNDAIFTTHKKSKFAIKSSKTNSQFMINPKNWKFKKNENGHDAAEYTFRMRDSDLYAMAINEQVEIGIEDLANIAFTNAKNAAPDVKVVKKEYRVVNGHKVIYMEMLGTIQSVKFKYLGYYYSNETGSTQFLAYTGANLVDKYQKDIDVLLNGFSVNQ